MTNLPWYLTGPSTKVSVWDLVVKPRLLRAAERCANPWCHVLCTPGLPQAAVSHTRSPLKLPVSLPTLRILTSPLISSKEVNLLLCTLVNLSVSTEPTISLLLTSPLLLSNGVRTPSVTTHVKLSLEVLVDVTDFVTTWKTVIFSLLVVTAPAVSPSRLLPLLSAREMLLLQRWDGLNISYGLDSVLVPLNLELCVAQPKCQTTAHQVVSVMVETRTGLLLTNLLELLIGLTTPLMVGIPRSLLLMPVEKLASPCTTVLLTPGLLKATVSPSKPETW
jgi:hypothetical protein